MHNIFEGNKELFKGLAIYDKWDWEDKYPVIKISFSGDMRSPEGLKRNILQILKHNQRRLQVKCDNINDYDTCFDDLIFNVYEKYNKRVVILIDEYDTPILTGWMEGFYDEIIKFFRNFFGEIIGRHSQQHRHDHRKQKRLINTIGTHQCEDKKYHDDNIGLIQIAPPYPASRA